MSTPALDNTAYPLADMAVIVRQALTGRQRVTSLAYEEPCLCTSLGLAEHTSWPKGPDGGFITGPHGRPLCCERKLTERPLPPEDQVTAAGIIEDLSAQCDKASGLVSAADFRSVIITHLGRLPLGYERADAYGALADLMEPYEATGKVMLPSSTGEVPKATARCMGCGSPLPPGSGPRRRACSPRCRTRLSRARKAMSR